MIHAGRRAGALSKSPQRQRAGRTQVAALGDPQVLSQSIRELSVIRGDMLGLEQRFAEPLRDVHPAFRHSARNLVHYLALRRHDVRALQERLATVGLSSLGRTESHVMAGIDAVLRVLHQMTGREWKEPAPGSPAIAFGAGNALLSAHTEELLGPRPPQRGVRIMVTMPSQAATDYEFVRLLLAHGMDCMRINCAHDDAGAWAGMVANVRRAKRELGRPCRVLMDIAGPKLRTGPIDPSSQILKWRPQRDRRGQIIAPARIWLSAAEKPQPPPGPADGCLHVPGSWLASRTPR